MDLNEKIEFDSKLSKINKLYTQYVNENMSELNVTRSEMSFLIKLYIKDNVSQESLSKLQEINGSTVTRALVRLEKKGYIKRVYDIADKRKKSSFNK